jgi:hypothetical protein
LADRVFVDPMGEFDRTLADSQGGPHEMTVTSQSSGPWYTDPEPWGSQRGRGV